VYVVQFNKEDEKEPEEQEIEEPIEKEEPSSTESESVTVVDSTFETTKTTTTEIVGPTSTTTLTTDIVSTPKEKSTGGKGDLNGVDTSIVHEAYVVDKGPEFEGGLSELYRFVSRHLKYPNKAYIEGKGGTVYVKFVVDEKGNVGRLTLQNVIGYDMDEEALRVVSMIPKFKSPATVKGQPVKTYYQLPIRFRYSN
jgi:periplasmic protein TonB